jgi:hypothetical protein
LPVNEQYCAAGDKNARSTSEWSSVAIMGAGSAMNNFKITTVFRFEVALFAVIIAYPFLSSFCWDSDGEPPKYFMNY